MKKVYVYAFSNVFIYISDGEIRLIADECDAEMIENGIDIAGAELINLDSVHEINSSVNFNDIDIEQEKILNDLLNKHIKDNNL